MVNTYDMASGQPISLQQEGHTDATRLPERQQPTVSCPGLSLQRLSPAPPPRMNAMPHDMAEMTIGPFLKQQQ